jgi:hypothetical protein
MEAFSRKIRELFGLLVGLIFLYLFWVEVPYLFSKYSPQWVKDTYSFLQGPTSWRSRPERRQETGSLWVNPVTKAQVYLPRGTKSTPLRATSAPENESLVDTFQYMRGGVEVGLALTRHKLDREPFEDAAKKIIAEYAQRLPPNLDIIQPFERSAAKGEEVYLAGLAIRDSATNKSRVDFIIWTQDYREAWMIMSVAKDNDWDVDRLNAFVGPIVRSTRAAH